MQKLSSWKQAVEARERPHLNPTRIAMAKTRNSCLQRLEMALAARRAGLGARSLYISSTETSTDQSVPARQSAIVQERPLEKVSRRLCAKASKMQCIALGATPLNLRSSIDKNIRLSLAGLPEGESRRRFPGLRRTRRDATGSRHAETPASKFPRRCGSYLTPSGLADYAA